MKHLLNNLSEEEKNRIREQHTGGMRVATDKFKMLVETKQGDVKPYLGEAAPEPVIDDKPDFKIGFLFDEGSSKIDPQQRQDAVDKLVDVLGSGGGALNNIKLGISGLSPIKTIKKFHNDSDFPLPKFIEIAAGTSHTGGGKDNNRVANNRLESLKSILYQAFNQFGLRDDIIGKLITRDNNIYKPSDFDYSTFDPDKVPSRSTDRFGTITIKPLTVKGLERDVHDFVSGKLDDYKGTFNVNRFINDVDEKGIAGAMYVMRTYSDLVDLDAFLKNSRIEPGGLEKYLNDQLKFAPNEMDFVEDSIRDAAKASGKENVVSRRGDRLIIDL